MDEISRNRDARDHRDTVDAAQAMSMQYGGAFYSTSSGKVEQGRKNKRTAKLDEHYGGDYDEEHDQHEDDDYDGYGTLFDVLGMRDIFPETSEKITRSGGRGGATYSAATKTTPPYSAAEHHDHEKTDSFFNSNDDLEGIRGGLGLARLRKNLLPRYLTTEVFIQYPNSPY